MDSYQFSLSKDAPPIIFERANALRKSMTKAEKILWEKIRNKKIAGLKFRRQHPIDIYILDFYCHEKLLGIEVDGKYHSDQEVFKNDENRTNQLEQLGIKIIRFTNEEVINNTSLVVEKIKVFCL